MSDMMTREHRGKYQEGVKVKINVSAVQPMAILATVSLVRLGSIKLNRLMSIAASAYPLYYAFP